MKMDSAINLRSPFEKGLKKPSDGFLIGVELEHFLLNKDNLRTISYGEEFGIAWLLKELAKRYNWHPIFENDNIIGLQRDNEHISLEPGGQFEFSSAPLPKLKTLSEQILNFYNEVSAIIAPQNLTLLSSGFNPFSSIEDITLVPKSRYAYMYDYMPKVGKLGRLMMKLTCSEQIAIDFGSESDALRKVVLATKLTPVFIALSANSVLAGGKVSGVASRRSEIWLDTDAPRTGIQPFVFSSSASFDDYISWALDSPMYFVERNGSKIPMSHLTFRMFLENGALLNGSQQKASEADWELHLSTLFPWVRLRHFVEIRSFDMQPLPLALALIALVRNIFYDEAVTTEVEHLINRIIPNKPTLDGLIIAAIQRGLDGECNGLSIRTLAAGILEAAVRSKQFSSDLKLISPLQTKLNKWSFEGEVSLASADPLSYLSSMCN